jgi:hypothetical protein
MAQTLIDGKLFIRNRRVWQTNVPVASRTRPPSASSSSWQGSLLKKWLRPPSLQSRTSLCPSARWSSHLPMMVTTNIEDHRSVAMPTVIDLSE